MRRMVVQARWRLWVAAVTLPVVLLAARPAAVASVTAQTVGYSTARAVQAARSSPTSTAAQGAQHAPLGPGGAQSAGGTTSVEVIPLVVRAHDMVTLRVHSQPLSIITVTITYPDGQIVTRRGRASGRGWYILRSQVLYEPVDRSAVAAVTVFAARGALFSATVQTTFTVLRRPMLNLAYLSVRPMSIHTGQTLEISVRAFLPYVQVHVTVLDPSQQSVSADGSTDASGTFSTSLPVSYSPHGSDDGRLLITALLSYEGQTRLLQQRVLVTAH